MKKKIIVFLLFAAGFCLSETQAQVKQATIIDNLETFGPGDGIIQITSDPKIIELIGIVSPQTSTSEKSYVKTGGFRIQVFMSNNSKTARGEMSNKVTLIKGTFPDVSVYTGYSAPNWKLLVGDFRTKEEAEVFKQKMLKSIPELGKEMYIVSDKVNIQVQKTN